MSPRRPAQPSEQHANPRGYRRLGELQLAHILLRQLNRRLDGPWAARQPSVRSDHAELQTHGHGIHHPAAADAAGRDVAKDVTHQAAWPAPHLRDRSRRGTHPHRNTPTFECRAGRRRSAQHPLPIPHHDFAVGPQVDEARRSAGLMQSHRHDAGQNVASDKASETG